MNIERTNRSIGGATVCVAGDYVGSSYFNSNPIDSPLQEQFQASTAIVNFEAPVDTGTSQPKYGPVLEQSETELQTLANAGVDAISLANNHTMDHGSTGLGATLETANEAGLDIVGAGENISKAISPIRITVGNSDVAIFNACHKEFGIADERTPGVVWIKHPEFEHAIEKTAKEADVLVVIAHGGTEYVPLPPPSWRQQLQSLADAGADAILAHHPHVPLPWEIHDGVPIFYSLGNFAFRQEGRPETAWSYFVELEIADREISNIGIRLTELNDGKVRPMTEQNQKARWEQLRDMQGLLDQAASEPGYWQEISTRIFPDRYEGRINDYGSGRILSSFRNPVYEGDRILRGVLKNSGRKQEQQLSLLNFFQNDCHRDVIETALELETGVRQDRRSENVQQEIDQKMQLVNSRSNWNRWKHWSRYVSMGIERIYSTILN